MDLVSDDALGLAKLARIFHERGDTAMADAASIKALATFERQRVTRPDSQFLAANIADLLVSAGRTVNAVPLLAEVSAQYPDMSGLTLKVAALQAWFGQDEARALVKTTGAQAKPFPADAGGLLARRFVLRG